MEAPLDPAKAFVVTKLMYFESEDCGYCKCRKERPGGLEHPPINANIPDENTHITIGCQVEQMSSAHYDDFINRGFRRSGKFMYTGDMLRGCCRMYTIRTSRDRLKILKEHRQVVNRFMRAIGDNPEQASGKSAGKQPAKKHDKKSTFDLRSLIEAEQSSKRFYTRFEPAGFSEEKYKLYKKYQTKVHNDDPEDVSRDQFKRFLCDSTFMKAELKGSQEIWKKLNSWVNDWKRGEKPEPSKRLGPTHECYYLDEKLIAISVIDFLPSGLSSVYLIWDPDYAHLSLGTLSGLREIQMCQELGLGYYYLGYYIHDCPKMKYKAKFGGEVLDVVNKAWIDLDKATPFMNDDKFFTLGNPSDTIKEPEPPVEKRGGRWKGPVEDISQALYETEKTYSDAQAHSEKLQLSYGHYGFELPDVLPGAMPMWALRDYLSKEPEKNVVSVLFAKKGMWSSLPLPELPEDARSYVIDFIRLFGYERLNDTILIV